MNLQKGDIAPFEDVLTELLTPTDEMMSAMARVLEDGCGQEHGYKVVHDAFTAAIKAALEG